MGDEAFEQEAYADVQASGKDPEKLTTAVMDAHSERVDGYVLPRFSIGVALEGEQTAAACPHSRVGPYEIVIRDGVPHARLILEADCTDRVAATPVPYAVPTQLFPGPAPGGQPTPHPAHDRPP